MGVVVDGVAAALVDDTEVVAVDIEEELADEQVQQEVYVLLYKRVDDDSAPRKKRGVGRRDVQRRSAMETLPVPMLFTAPQG